jgi:putative endonuclease
LREEKRYYVYIMASRSLTLYTGVTGDIYHRSLQNKSDEIEGFTKKYHVNRLVYYGTFKYVNNAIAREKQIKAWTRAKRLALIKTLNPTWQDLAEGWGELTRLQIPRSTRDDNLKSDVDPGGRVSLFSRDETPKEDNDSAGKYGNKDPEMSDSIAQAVPLLSRAKTA